MQYGQHPKAFLNLLLIILCIGISIGESFQQQLTLSVILVLSSAAVIILIYCGILTHRKHKLTWIFFALLVLLLAIIRFYTAIFISPQDIYHQRNQECLMTGTIQSEPVIRRDSQGTVHIKYILKCQALKKDDELLELKGNLLVYARNDSFDANKRQDPGASEKDPIIKDLYGGIGDTITLSGKPKEIHDYQNPGRMNMVMTNISQDIRCQISPDKYSITVEKGQRSLIDDFSSSVRNMFRDSMEQVMPTSDAAAIFAMLFGGYNGIKPELLEAFTTTGIIHILSVSGSHITLMAATAGIIGRTLHLPAMATSFLAAITIVIYSILAGALMPVIRSAIMGLLTLTALTMEREQDSQHILTITAICLLLYQPLSLFDISFQLSFGATAGLLYLAPILRKWLRYHLPRFAADTIAMTIAAQLSVLPLLAWYFHAVSFSSLIANLAVTPIVELIIVIGLTAGILTALIPVIGKFVFIIASLALGAVYELSKTIAGLPFSKVYVPVMAWHLIIPYYLFLSYFCLPQKQQDDCKKILRHLLAPAPNKKLFLPIMFLVTIAVASFFHLHNRTLQVHFIDVGQGDAALIITPHGRAFMIDTGGNRSGDFDIGERVDVPYLLHYGVTCLDYIFLTHAHDDHAKGTRGVIKKLPTGAIVTGLEGTDTYLKVFGGGNNTIRKELITPMKEGNSWILDGVQIQFLHIPAPTDKSSKDNRLTSEQSGNEFSTVIRISYGNASFLFTGDLGKEQEASLMEKTTDLSSTVLKVAHHGSRTSSSEEFLRAVNPKWSIISAGYENSFGHPHHDVLERINTVTDSKLLRTDLNGAIVFETDGNTIKVSTYK